MKVFIKIIVIFFACAQLLFAAVNQIPPAFMPLLDHASRMGQHVIQETIIGDDGTQYPYLKIVACDESAQWDCFLDGDRLVSVSRLNKSQNKIVYEHFGKQRPTLIMGPGINRMADKPPFYTEFLTLIEKPLSQFVKKDEALAQSVISIPLKKEDSVVLQHAQPRSLDLVQPSTSVSIQQLALNSGNYWWAMPIMFAVVIAVAEVKNLQSCEICTNQKAQIKISAFREKIRSRLAMFIKTKPRAWLSVIACTALSASIPVMYNKELATPLEWTALLGCGYVGFCASRALFIK